MVVRARLRDYLKGAAARGELQIEDFDLAAEQFAEVCRADLVPRLIFNIDTEFSAEERERVIAGAVELFLARYGG